MPRRLFVALLLSVCLLPPPATRAKDGARALTVRYGDAGLASLRYGDTDLLADGGGLSVQKAVLTAGHESREAALTPTQTIVLATRPHTVRRTYPWGPWTAPTMSRRRAATAWR